MKRDDCAAGQESNWIVAVTHYVKDYQAMLQHTTLRPAQVASDHEAMQLAVDLRRLANRLQAVGDFLTNAGQGLIELEDRILIELDERYRGQSTRNYAA